MKRWWVVLNLAFIFCLPLDAAALTVIEGDGKAYPIVEQSQADNIKNQYIKEKKERDKLSPKELENKYVVHLTKVPDPASENRVRNVDPSYTLPFDITDSGGKIIKEYKKGYTFNPLDKITMTSLIVIDGNKEDQITWAQKLNKEISPSKILLSKGSFIAVARKYRLRVYHLNDDIMNRMGIERVPCTVIQKGNMLEVAEYRSDRLPQ
jgi:hypothetical protein